MGDIHGGNGLTVAEALGIDPETLLDLSSNTFLGCTDLTATLIARPYPFAHYPDPQAACFRRAVAAYESMPEACVVPGAGAAELIWLVFGTVRPRRVLMLGPMFSEYARACAAQNIPFSVLTPPAERGFEPDAANLRAIAAADADMVVICLPNNPGGLAYADRNALFEALGSRCILADLSYRDFLHGTPQAVDHQGLARLCAPGARLISLHSLTKFFCCPGIRLGYALAEEDLITRLRAMQPPWMIPDFAAQVGEQMLAQVEAYRERLPVLRDQVRALANMVSGCGLFVPELVFPGVSFVTARLKNPAGAAYLHQTLLQRRILVRVCDTIPGMPPGFIRIQARSPEALRPLRESLSDLYLFEITLRNL